MLHGLRPLIEAAPYENRTPKAGRKSFGHRGDNNNRRLVIEPLEDRRLLSVDLIRNGAFGGVVSPSDWATTGAFHADSRFTTNYHNSPGYAYLSKADGSAGNNLIGEMSSDAYDSLECNIHVAFLLVQHHHAGHRLRCPRLSQRHCAEFLRRLRGSPPDSTRI